jgi:hypothetical protein
VFHLSQLQMWILTTQMITYVRPNIPPTAPATKTQPIRPPRVLADFKANRLSLTDASHSTLAGILVAHGAA